MNHLCRHIGGIQARLFQLARDFLEHPDDIEYEQEREETEDAEYMDGIHELLALLNLDALLEAFGGVVELGDDGAEVSESQDRLLG